MSERTSNPAGATSGQGGQKQEKSKFRMESQQERTARAKLQMEKRWDKLETARNRLANQKPPKKRGPLRRMGGAAGHGVHGFVHGKHKEAENEEIVDIVRGMSIPLDELPLLLQKLRGTSGQAGQKPAPAETGVAE